MQRPAISDVISTASGTHEKLLGHFFGTLEIELVGLEAHAPLVMDGALGLDAQEHLMGLGIVLFR